MPNTEIDPESRPALAARVRVQNDLVRGEPVLLYPEGLLELNGTAQEVVSRCDGKTSVNDILYSLGQEYDVSMATLRADVFETLAELQRRQLIVFNA